MPDSNATRDGTPIGSAHLSPISLRSIDQPASPAKTIARLSSSAAQGRTPMNRDLGRINIHPRI